MPDRKLDLEELEAALRGWFAYGTSGIKLNGRPVREAVAGALGVCRNTVDGWATGKNGVRLPAAALVAEAALHPEGCTLARACDLAGGLFVPLDRKPGNLGRVLRASSEAKKRDAVSEMELANTLADGVMAPAEARILLDLETKQLAAQHTLVALLRGMVEEGDRVDK